MLNWFAKPSTNDQAAPEPEMTDIQAQEPTTAESSCTPQSELPSDAPVTPPDTNKKRPQKTRNQRKETVPKSAASPDSKKSGKQGDVVSVLQQQLDAAQKSNANLREEIKHWRSVVNTVTTTLAENTLKPQLQLAAIRSLCESAESSVPPRNVRREKRESKQNAPQAPRQNGRPPMKQNADRRRTGNPFQGPLKWSGEQPPLTNGAPARPRIPQKELPLLRSPAESDHPICVHIREQLREANDEKSLLRLIEQADSHKIQDLVDRGRRKLEKIMAI